jgi:hypothetical protein
MALHVLATGEVIGLTFAGAAQAGLARAVVFMVAVAAASIL